MQFRNSEIRNCSQIVRRRSIFVTLSLLLTAQKHDKSASLHLVENMLAHCTGPITNYVLVSWSQHLTFLAKRLRADNSRYYCFLNSEQILTVTHSIICMFMQHFYYKK